MASVRSRIVVKVEKGTTYLLESTSIITADLWPVAVGVLTQVVLRERLLETPLASDTRE